MIANAIPWWKILAAVEFEWQVTGGTAVAIILGGLVLCVLLGFWAGKVASNKGKSFGAFFALAFFLTLFCGIGGIVVVIVAYAMSPAPGYEGPVRAPGAVPPPGTYGQPQAPPQAPPQQPQAPQYLPQPPPQAPPQQPPVQQPPQPPPQAAPPPPPVPPQDPGQGGGTPPPPPGT